MENRAAPLSGSRFGGFNCQDTLMKNQKYSLGLDVGSTTVKAVVLNRDLEILFSHYQRHQTKQAQCTLNLLQQIEAKFPDFNSETCSAYMTGSGASSLTPLIGARFVQEVNAVATAVEKLHPNAQSVVELGGQDAKVIVFKENPGIGKRALTFMNDKCASGTGATLDKCMIKVGLENEDLVKIQFDPGKLHHVAAKCGVFAETDIVNLIKSGIPKHEIMASLADAIVFQNLSVLTKGNTLQDEVILLGGPNTYLPFLVECWRHRIAQIWKERGFTKLLEGDITKKIYVPDNSLYYAALGSCYYGELQTQKSPYIGSSTIQEFIDTGRKSQLKGMAGDPLVKDSAELLNFKEEYKIPNFQSYSPQPGEVVRAFLGIDGGSTSTKCALINDKGELLMKEYTLSKGNPLEDFRILAQRILDFYKTKNATVDVIGLGVTGYAAPLLEKILTADMNVIETIAHMKSSQQLFGETDVICDIGGQDIKVLFLKSNELAHFKLSNQCSAGNGMILQGMAEQFGHKVTEYADQAFKAEIAPVFSYGCGVFLDTDRVNFQKLGFSKEEIMAGLAQVLPKNIWQYVVQIPRLEQFGTRFVLQGGTQYNLAALKAQVDYIKKRVKKSTVNVHPHPGEAGAIGAALEALDIVSIRGYTKFVGLEESLKIEFSTRSDESTRCHFCPNLCSRTFVDATTSQGHKVRHISGFSCEKGTVESKEELKLLAKKSLEARKKSPNLVKVQTQKLFDTDLGVVPQSSKEIEFRKNIKIAMPKALNMWVMAPFFNAYFQSLGVPKENLLWSSETNEKMAKEGMKYGSIDPCYPGKVAQAHLHQILFHMKADYIYFPAITHIPNYLQKTMASTSCPVVQGTPLVMRASFTAEKDYFAEKNMPYVNDAVDFYDGIYGKKQLFKTWKDRLKITSAESDLAFAAGFKALKDFELAMESKGKEILERAQAEKTMAVLMIGRPYHLDSGMNHGILDEMQALGFPILTMTSIPKDKEWLGKYFEGNPLDINDVWPENFSTNSAQKVWAAKLAARIPNLAVVDISSFKCGHDAPTYGIIDSIVAASKAAYIALHDLDQTSPTGSFRIRLKTFAYNLEKRIEKMKRGPTWKPSTTEITGPIEIHVASPAPTETVSLS